MWSLISPPVKSSVVRRSTVEAWALVGRGNSNKTLLNPGFKPFEIVDHFFAGEMN